MRSSPKIYVIHRDGDEERREFISKRYSESGLAFEIIPAIDGHDLSALKPYASLIPNDFWGKPAIKPGALGCFLSHRRAWKTLYDSKLEHAIIAEDDSAPAKDLKSVWSRYQAQLRTCDVLFINNRLATWTTKSYENVTAAITGPESVERISQSPYRAPGADAYLIKRETARDFLRLSEKYQVCCGVDWFMLGCVWNKNKPASPDTKEFEFVKERFAEEGKNLKGKISGKPLYKISESLKSSIVHSESINIEELKAKLRSA